MKKYECLKEFEAPKLNDLLAANIKGVAVNREYETGTFSFQIIYGALLKIGNNYFSKHMMDIQKLAGTALSIIGSLVSSFYQDDPDLSLEDSLTMLCDTAKIISLITFKQTNSRKAFIEPAFSQNTKELLKSQKTDEFLYGTDLADKLKQDRSLKKIGENLKLPQTQGPAVKAKNNSALNQKTPFAPRPQIPQMGYTSSRGRQRPRVFLKSRQQFVNPQAQMPYRPKPAQPQEKKP